MCAKQHEIKSLPEHKTQKTSPIVEINADSVIYTVLQIDSLNLVDFYTIDLNEDNFEDLIILTNPPKYPDDPGEFSSLTIYLTKIGVQTFDPVDVFDTLPKDFSTSVPSQLNTDLIGVYPFKEGTIIFAFGYPYGSGRATSLAIHITDKTITKIFEGEYNQIISLSGLSETPELTLRKNEEYWGFVDSVNIALTSYCPYQVLTLENEEFILDSLLTKKYNEENYVFEGFESYNPDITIAVPRGGSKPYVYQRK